jgi:predicted Zn-dependent protease
VPHSDATLINVGLAYERLNQPQRAVELLRPQALQSTAGPPIVLAYGRALRACGETAAAAEQFRRAHALALSGLHQAPPGEMELTTSVLE